MCVLIETQFNKLCVSMLISCINNFLFYTYFCFQWLRGASEGKGFVI